MRAPLAFGTIAGERDFKMSNYVTVDGNEVAAHVAYDFTEVAAIYPITLFAHGRAYRPLECPGPPEHVRPARS